MRVFNNRIKIVKEAVEKAGAEETYMAMQTVVKEKNGRKVAEKVQIAPSLLFVRWDEKSLVNFRFGRFGEFMIYTKPGKPDPAPISDEEMRIFMLVTSASGSDKLEYLGERFEYKTGDRVRVTEGPYKGAEGVIRRIKKDRKLIVAINGVAVVAVSHIPSQFLEKL